MQTLTRQKLETPYGTLKYAEYVPDEYNETNVPLLLASGWSESIESLEETVLALGKIGKKIFVLDHSSLTYQADTENGFPASGYTKAEAFIQLLDEKEIKTIDVVAHSEGAINASIAATMYPERFQSLILVAPGGFLLKDSFLKLSFRFTRNILSTLWYKNKMDRKGRFRYVKEVFLYFLQNPIQTLSEARAVSRFRVAPLIKTLKENGVYVYVIHGTNDRVFPAPEVEKAFRESKLQSFRFLSAGGHNDIHAQPEEFVEIIKQALQDRISTYGGGN